MNFTGDTASAVSSRLSFLRRSISGKSSSRLINLQFRLPDLFSNTSSTFVGEPLNPHRDMSAPSIALSHTVISDTFERILGKRRVFIRSTVISDGSGKLSSPVRVRHEIAPSALNISITFVITPIPIVAARHGPTCAVSPSVVCRPQIIRSYSRRFNASERIYAVASVSEPAKALSHKSITFTPSRVSSSSGAFAESGPILITVTSSQSRSAHSTAYLSNSFISPPHTFAHTTVFICTRPLKHHEYACIF